MLCKDILLILFQILGYKEYISIASNFFNNNNSAVFVLILAFKGLLSFKNIKASPKCSLFLISIIFKSVLLFELEIISEEEDDFEEIDEFRFKFEVLFNVNFCLLFEFFELSLDLTLLLMNF